MLVNAKKFVANIFMHLFEEIIDSGKVDNRLRSEPTLGKDSTANVDESGSPVIRLD